MLSRFPEQELVIGDDIVIKVLRVDGDKVRIGVSAPRDVSVHRREVYDAIARVYSDEEE